MGNCLGQGIPVFAFSCGNQVVLKGLLLVTPPFKMQGRFLDPGVEEVHFTLFDPCSGLQVKRTPCRGWNTPVTGLFQEAVGEAVLIVSPCFLSLENSRGLKGLESRINYSVQFRNEGGDLIRAEGTQGKGEDLHCLLAGFIPSVEASIQELIE